jgi:two-component system sensor kinase FixL
MQRAAIQNPDEREARRSELASTLQEWRSAQHTLRDSIRRQPERDSIAAAIERGFDQLQPHFDAMMQAATTMTLGQDAGGDEDSVRRLLEHESAFLTTMDSIVGLYADDARAHVTQLRWMGLVIMLAILMALVFLQTLMVRPVVKQVGNRIELSEARYRELNEKLAHSDRLISLGTMATALAHEINQPLGAISNYAEGCLNQLDNPSHRTGDFENPLRRILWAAHRCAEIIRRTRNFTRPRPHRVSDESINELVREVVELCGPELRRRDVVLNVDLDDSLPLIPVDGIQIQQVLTNLLQNAMAAVEQSSQAEPCVFLTTRRSSLDEIEVAVSDNGPGLPPEGASKWFEPFVTTREHGSGMGLAISQRIIELHSGRIWAESNEQGGAVFRFRLPISAPHCTPADRLKPITRRSEMTEPLCHG